MGENLDKSAQAVHTLQARLGRRLVLFTRMDMDPASASTTLMDWLKMFSAPGPRGSSFRRYG